MMITMSTIINANEATKSAGYQHHIAPSTFRNAEVLLAFPSFTEPSEIFIADSGKIIPGVVVPRCSARLCGSPSPLAMENHQIFLWKPLEISCISIVDSPLPG